jgi:hypothetical protein
VNDDYDDDDDLNLFMMMIMTHYSLLAQATLYQKLIKVTNICKFFFVWDDFQV